MVKEEKKPKKETEATKVLVGKPILAHGRIFEGIIVKKFPARVVIEFARTVYVPKYERFYKKKTRLHARLPSNIDVNIGDLVKIAECRPLSKLVHFIVIGKVIKSKASNSTKLNENKTMSGIAREKK